MLLLLHPLAQQPVLEILNQDFDVFFSPPRSFFKTSSRPLSRKYNSFLDFFLTPKSDQKTHFCTLLCIFVCTKNHTFFGPILDFSDPSGTLKKPFRSLLATPIYPFLRFWDLSGTPQVLKISPKNLKKPVTQKNTKITQKHKKSQKMTFFQKVQKIKNLTKNHVFFKIFRSKKSQICTKCEKMNFIGISRPLFQVPKGPGGHFLGVLKNPFTDPSFFNFAPKLVSKTRVFRARRI